MCNIEKHIIIFYKEFSECKDCNRAIGFERYYGNKDEVSMQQNICYEKNREKISLQKQNNRCIQIRDLVRSYGELETRLKAMEERLKNFSAKDSENN